MTLIHLPWHMWFAMPHNLASHTYQASTDDTSPINSKQYVIGVEQINMSINIKYQQIIILCMIKE